MQQEAFANTEDFGGPDIVAGPGKISQPGQDAPYARYELARAYDEMFAPDGTVRPPYVALDSRLSPCRWKNCRAASRPANRASCTRASPSPSIATMLHGRQHQSIRLSD